MQKMLTPAERLIVAADFKPMASNRKDWVKTQVLALAKSLEGTGVYLKVNSALRACGYGLIGEIQSLGLRVFADLKLCDIGATLAMDGALLQEAKPDIVTAMCVSGVAPLKDLKWALPDTEVLGVTVLTSLNEHDAKALFGQTILGAVRRLANIAVASEIDGLVMSPAELVQVRGQYGTLSINTPGIRPSWAMVQGDDQNPDRVMTPAKAIKAGADRIVVGRPIVQAFNPYDAVMQTIAEIEKAMGAE